MRNGRALLQLGLTASIVWPAVTEAAPPSTVQLAATNGRTVVTNSVGDVHGGRDPSEVGATWRMIRHGDRSVSFRSIHGTYLGVDGGRIVATSKRDGPNERWLLLRVGSFVRLKHKKGAYLNMTTDGVLALSEKAVTAFRLKRTAEDSKPGSSIEPAPPKRRRRPTAPRRYAPRREQAMESPFDGEEAPSRGRSARCKDTMPAFPSPIPTPSARMALPPNFLKRTASKPAPRLSDAAEELHALLLRAGYSEQAYYALRNDGRRTGFALVTRIERIRSDGTPFPAEERFLAANAPDQFNVL
ncbi:MAG: hypothetical protein AAFV29_16125, partial [Myxococcota bacterium]